MNPRRVLAILNVHLKFNSYSLHAYQSNGAYTTSKLAISVYASTTAVYLSALYIHYTKQDYFEQYTFLSKLFYNCIYRHLYLGCMAALLIPLSFWGQRRFAHDMAALVQQGLLTRRPASSNRLDLSDLLVFYKLYANLIVFLGLSVYNLLMLDWNNFAWFKLMLFLGLFLPHFHIANILHFFCVNALLLRQMCLRINDDMRDAFIVCERAHRKFIPVDGEDDHHKAGVGAVIRVLYHHLMGTQPSNPKPSFVPVLETVSSSHLLHQHLTENLKNFILLQSMTRRLNTLLQKQLFVLTAQHLLVVFVAAHSFLKIKQQWKEFVPAADITSITVNFKLYLCLVINDFVCLFAAGSLYRIAVSRCNTIPFESAVLCYYFVDHSGEEDRREFNVHKISGHRLSANMDFLSSNTQQSPSFDHIRFVRDSFEEFLDGK